MQNEPINLKITLNSAKKAEGKLYLDDGETTDYSQGKYSLVKYEFDENKLNAKFEKNAYLPEKIGNYSKVEILGFNKKPAKIIYKSYNGPEIELNKFKFDEKMRTLEISLSNSQINILTEFSLTIY